MSLRRTLIVAGAGFMLAAGLAAAVLVMAIPPWVWGINSDLLKKRVTVDEAVAARMATICLGIPVAEAEPAHTVQTERPGSPPILNRRRNDQWRAFLAQMQEGDELWTFCTSPESWEHMAGLGGIALVRHGKVVGHFTTLLQ